MQVIAQESTFWGFLNAYLFILYIFIYLSLLNEFFFPPFKEMNRFLLTELSVSRINFIDDWR